MSEQMKSIAHEILTQDNRATSDPIFIVFQKRRMRNDAGVPFYFKQDSDGNKTLDGVEERGFACK